MANVSKLTAIQNQPINKSSLILSGGSNSHAKSLLQENRDGVLGPLSSDGGIIFENTPNISVTYNSQYSPVELSHTNYDYNSFGKSNISNMTVVAKFTAQTLDEADYLLSVYQFLRTFSKMNYGVNDPQKGMPPAIMKFSAYGKYMLQNVPVALRFFTLSLPDNVDYVQTSHETQVPIYSEFSLDLVPMPTPNKVKNEFSLGSFASGELITKGYL